jgi:ADP-L-glycero-D-manno-heptose 6-epimerase
MIVITGALGFIGSCMLTKLNQQGHTEIFLVDDFSKHIKDSNIKNKLYFDFFERDMFFSTDQYARHIDFVFHIGARTDTTEFNSEIFNELNLNYSKKIWKYCSKHKIPLIYASSASTYGDGKLGYDDKDDSIINKLIPLNPYAKSKNDFDKWVLEQDKKPPYWYGLKFFNVFGPNEYHKDRMSSVVYHAYNQITKTGKFDLFKSHNPDYKDGEQKRDFIYVKDVVDVMYFLMLNKPKSGIYNLGTGKSRTFLDLVNCVFNNLNKKPNINFIDIPVDIRDKYQYFTEAKMDKLYSLGYIKSFYTLENAIDDYIKNYLINNLNF